MRQKAAGTCACLPESDALEHPLKFQQVYYVLDEALRILWIGGEWDDFALTNGGTKARSNQVLATPLLDHVAGASTQASLARMISVVREVQAPLRIDYRCDAPRMLRRVRLTIQPMKNNRVLMVHDLRDARTFEEPLPAWHASPEATAQKCSFCGAVRQGGGAAEGHGGGAAGGHGWDFAEDLGARHPTAVAYVVCPACIAQIDEVVTGLRARRQPRNPAAGGFGPSEASE